jgi:hydroxypyruvate reductase
VLDQPNLLGDAARTAFDAAVRCADPAKAVQAELSRAPLSPLPEGAKTYVIALGKAAPAMLRQFRQTVSGPMETLCVTHRENTEDVTADQLFRAGHPVPDEEGLRAGQAICEMLGHAKAQDRVVALISGGGSALVPAPPDGVSLEDKQTLNRLLLESGLGINDMNLIRQQVSDLKGGGFAQLAAPATVTALILSDVIGDDLRAVASGPTVAPIGTAQDALQLMREVWIEDRLPESILNHLTRETVAPDIRQSDNRLIGSNRQSVEAAAHQLGDRFDVTVAEEPLIGNLNEAATRVFRAGLEKASEHGPQAIVWGGETTVRVRGNGMGGRNQELALRVAALADAQPIDRPWVFLSGGTDGRDGPTDSAGAVVDQATCERIRMRGRSAASFLDRNDSYAALALSGDHLMTGATGTNVADIQILLIE